jgi:GTPase Era involved in 16S rRNA processing
MVTFQQQKQQVLKLFQSAIALAKSQHRPEIQERLEQAANHLAEGKLFVVVCGEFKQGKSNLLNAFLNEKDLFPVDVDITTNLVSTITYGKEEEIRVIVGEPQNERSQAIQRSEIANYVTEQRNRNNLQQAKMLMIKTPNPQLKDGLILVDTPGVGSLNIEHTAISYAFIPNADAILFVSDALAPLSAKELEFIQDKILPHCQNLIFAVTKIDAVRDYEAIVESDREKLAQILGKPGCEIPIIPVSSTLKLSYLDSSEPEDLEDSNFSALEQELWTFISERRGQILLLHALTELGRGVADIKQPLQVEWDAFQQKTRQELDDLEREYQDNQKQLQCLLDSNATWRTRLSDGLQEVRTQILEQFQDGFAAIHRQTNKYVDDKTLLESPEQIASLLEGDIDSLMSKLGRQMGHLAANLQAEIELATGLNLNPFEVGSLEHQKSQLALEEIRGKTPGSFGKAMQMTRSATFNMTAAGTIGGLAGTLIGSFFGGVGAIPGQVAGAAIGTGLAGLIGLAHGAMEGLQQAHEKTKHTVLVVIKQFIEESQKHCSRTLNRAIKELEIFMRDELTDLIKREKETCDRTLRSLQDARKLSQEQAQQRSKELQVQLQQLNQIQKEALHLAESAATIATSVPQETKPPVPQPKVSEPSQTPVASGVDYGDWANE